MGSTPVHSAPAFLQLPDKYKQDLVEELTNTCYWPVVFQTLGNDLNSKPWGVNYAIGPKKCVNRLVPRSVAWVARAPLPLHPVRTILMLAPCKLG